MSSSWGQLNIIFHADRESALIKYWEQLLLSHHSSRIEHFVSLFIVIHFVNSFSPNLQLRWIFSSFSSPSLTSCWPYFTIFTCQCFNFCVNFLISYLIKLVIVIFISSFSSVSTQLLPILANLHGPIFQLTFGEILNWTLACKCCCTTDKLEQLERLNLCLWVCFVLYWMPYGSALEYITLIKLPHSLGVLCSNKCDWLAQLSSLVGLLDAIFSVRQLYSLK